MKIEKIYCNSERYIHYWSIIYTSIVVIIAMKDVINLEKVNAFQVKLNSDQIKHELYNRMLMSKYGSYCWFILQAK